MPLVNTFQIPQDLGKTPTPASLDMYKMAGSNQALTDLGLLSAEELEKTAWVAPALAAAGRVLPWLGRGVKGLWNAGGKAIGTVASPIGAAGRGATQAVGSRLGASPATIAKIQGLGKGMAREGVTFGLLGGGLNAAMAEPGQRGEAFARGFGSGVLGGMAWRGAGNVASAGLKRGLGKHFAGVETASKQPWFAKLEPGQSRLKGYGAKALLGGVPFAAGMAAASFTPSFEGHAQQQSPYPQYAQPVARLGSQVMGAYPGGYGYNPNLPLPQGGY